MAPIGRGALGLLGVVLPVGRDMLGLLEVGDPRPQELFGASGGSVARRLGGIAHTSKT